MYTLQNRMPSINSRFLDLYGTLDAFCDFSAIPKPKELLPLTQDDDNFIVSASIPGLTPKGVSISISNGVITIAIDQETGNKESNKSLEIKRSYHEKRSFYLDGVKEEEISASLIAGKLVVTLPKIDSLRTKRVKVSTE